MRVIKLGGNILEQPEEMKALFESLVDTQNKTVIVHGGGALAQQWLSTAGLKSEKHEGLRVSPEQHMPYIVGALAGCANKQLMSQAIATGIRPIGLTLHEAGISCRRQSAALGQVGTCELFESGLITNLLKCGYLPLISSIGFGKKGDWFNVNADDAAVAVAANYDADLLLLTDVEGVLDSEGRLIEQLNTRSIDELTKAGVIQNGMLVKVRGALEAARHLRRSVRIGSWNAVNKPDSGTQISE